MKGPLQSQIDVLDHALTRPQALAAVWCIENLVPAIQAAANRYEVVFYEELLEHPEVEWRRIAAALGMAVVPSSVLLQQPSQQAAVRLQKRETPTSNYSETYSSWRARLSNEDLNQISNVLRAFGIEFYTTSESRPDVDSFKRRFLSQ